MLISAWKSLEEIEYALADVQKVAVFSCNICANLSGTGGSRGLHRMKKLLKKWGKHTVVTKTVNACCSEEIMRQCIRIYIEPIRDKCDALLMISCAGGVKSAFLCNPGVPVIAALDSTGSGVVSTSKNTVDVGICTACGHCVLTYTGGICPVTECLARKKYGPCSKAPKDGNRCVVDTERPCVWKIIQKNADMEALVALSQIHKQKDYERVQPVELKSSPMYVRRSLGWFMARLPGVDWLIGMLR